jgi:hypothetical protein
MDSLIAQVTELEKAVREGVQGKYRRVDGKTVFIRSDDEKVTKGPDRLKGRKLVMKHEIGSAHTHAAFGEPSGTVMMTDKDKTKKTCKCLEKGSCGCSPVVNSLEKKLGEIHSTLSAFVPRTAE